MYIYLGNLSVEQIEERTGITLSDEHRDYMKAHRQEAVNAVRNMFRSLENRTRSLYNYGYKDGFKDGVETATREIVEKIVAEKLDEGGDQE